MKFNERFLDIYGMVLPQPKHEDKPCDNGTLFTSVAVLLGFDSSDYKKLVRQNYLKTGLIARWKGNNYDQMAWDCYLGVAVACIKLGISDIPKEVLSYGAKNFFIYNTDGKIQFKDFLGRNFPIWPLMICAAFPKIKYIMYPILYTVQKFFKKPDLSDTSGIQLQWVFLEGCRLLGFRFKKLQEHQEIIPQAFSIYYHKKHPFNDTGVVNVRN